MGYKRKKEVKSAHKDFSLRSSNLHVPFISLMGEKKKTTTSRRNTFGGENQEIYNKRWI